MFIDQIQWQRVDVAGRNGRQADALLTKLLDQRRDRRIPIAQAERMGYGHLALEAERTGPLDHQTEFPATERTPIVQVNVDAASVTLGDAEDAIQMGDRVTIEPSRVDTTDHRRTSTDRSIQQISRSRCDQETALRKRDDLDVDPIGELCCRFQHAFDR